MKISGEFILSELMGEYVMVPVGETALKFNGIVGLNDVAVFIWKQLQEDISREELLSRILEEFEVTGEEADRDLEEFLQVLRNGGLLEEKSK